MGCEGSKNNVKNTTSRQAPVNFKKPQLNPAIQQYKDTFMAIQDYENYTVALNDAKTSASGTQDDDYAIVG